MPNIKITVAKGVYLVIDFKHQQVRLFRKDTWKGTHKNSCVSILYW